MHIEEDFGRSFDEVAQETIQGELTEEQRSLNDWLPTTMASYEGSRRVSLMSLSKLDTIQEEQEGKPMESVSPYQGSPVPPLHDQKMKSDKSIPSSEPLDFTKVTKDVVLKKESSVKGMLLLQHLSVVRSPTSASTSTSIKRQDQTVVRDHTKKSASVLFNRSPQSTLRRDNPATEPQVRQSVPVSRERTSSHGIPLRGRYSCLVSRPLPEEPKPRLSSRRESVSEVDRLRNENLRLRETIEKQTKEIQRLKFRIRELEATVKELDRKPIRHRS